MPVSDSAYAAAAQTVTPVFAPAGFGNWEAVGALAVGFVAKEAVISSWSQTYAVEEPSELDAPGALGDAVRGTSRSRLRRTHHRCGLGVHDLPAGIHPCVATLATQWREIGRKWTLFGVGVQPSVAWVAAVAVFQVGRLLSRVPDH